MTTIETPPNLSFPQGELSFKTFVQKNLLTDLKFGASWETLKLAKEVELACGQEGDLTISTEALSLLKQVVQQPTRGYQPEQALSVFPFLQAIMDAQ